MSLILVAIFAILIIYLAKHYYKGYLLSSRLKWIPGPTGFPLIGNALQLKSTTHVLKAHMQFVKEFGGMYKLKMGPVTSFVVVTDVKLLDFVMSSMKTIDKGRVHVFLQNWLGLGLLTATGQKWHQRRKIITPTFHFKILEQFIDVFNKESDILVEKLRKEVGKESVDIYPYISLCALDIICESAMGISLNNQSNHHSEYIDSVKAMGQIIMRRIISPLKVLDFFYYLSRDYYKERKHLKVLHGMTNKVIKNRRAELLKTGNVAVNADAADDGSKKRSPFLDTLIHATINGQPLTDEDIREEVDTFMFEGHDTTSSGISFVLYVLSKHPDVQNRVFDELKGIFGGDQTGHATYKDLQDMKYLEMVIKESFRIYPPVPLFGRLLKEDIEFDGNVYPEGLLILLFPYGVHRNSETYPDPEKFDPERFSTENQAGRHPFAYIPFSAGPRNCIGQKFAMLELKSTISKLLRSYEILPVAGFEPILAAELILKSENGIHIGIKKRVY